MSQDEVFFGAYDGIELDLPNGRHVKLKPLPLDRAAHWYRLALKAASITTDGDLEETAGRAMAVVELAEGFPREVNAVDEFRGLSPVELVGIVVRFFWASPSRNGSTAPSNSG